MLTLYLETSTREASVALADRDQLLGQLVWSAQQGSAGDLTLKLQQLFDEHRREPNQLQQIVVSRGPGSFTGLRVSVVAAKTICYALRIPAIGLCSLQAAGWPALEIAQQQNLSHVRVIADAQRNELFCLDWTCDQTQPASHLAWTASNLSIQPRANWLSTCGPQQLVTGPAMMRLQAEIESTGSRLAPVEVSQSTAARLFSFHQWLGPRQPPPESALTLTPEYGRLSAAEEKRLTVG